MPAGFSTDGNLGFSLVVMVNAQAVVTQSCIVVQGAVSSAVTVSGSQYSQRVTPAKPAVLRIQHKTLVLWENRSFPGKTGKMGKPGFSVWKPENRGFLVLPQNHGFCYYARECPRAVTVLLLCGPLSYYPYDYCMMGPLHYYTLHGPQC